jgi:hypothetical protein
MNNSGCRRNIRNQSILYHYTSLSGLKGIVENGKIWATNILYLNDSEEYFNAKEAFNSVFDTMWDTPEIIDTLDEIEQDFLSLLTKRIEDIFEDNEDGFKVFVSSFSESADKLSQWSGYCPSGSGVCIGFDFMNLTNIPGCQLVKCIYVKQSMISDEEHDGFNQVYKFIDGYLKMFQSFENDQNKEEKKKSLLQDFEREFLKFATRVKDPGFKEENEWRLILTLDETRNDEVLYRSGKSMLIPYIEINIRDENKHLNIPDIWVGPTPNPYLSRISIADFLYAQKVYAYKYQEDITNPTPPFFETEDKDPMGKVAPNVRISEIPYRDW